MLKTHVGAHADVSTCTLLMIGVFSESTAHREASQGRDLIGVRAYIFVRLVTFTMNCLNDRWVCPLLRACQRYVCDSCRFATVNISAITSRYITHPSTDRSKRNVDVRRFQRNISVSTSRQPFMCGNVDS